MIDLKVSIPAAETGYYINIGNGNAPEKIKKHQAAGGFIVADRRVADLYPHLFGSDRIFYFDASEDNKNIQSITEILSWLQKEGALRDSQLMAVGGGITGDTAAFASAIYMRGIKVIQAPTTLLSMVDSSVGGKTGVNFAGIKNNVGAFHQPIEVVIDTNFLKTLPDAEFFSGLAESIKISAVSDREFFDFLRKEKDLIKKRDSGVMEKVIAKSCSLKAAIVEEDEKESGKRKLLNFGHTIAHAIETDSSYKIHHGYAVAMGMVYETEFALKKGIADKETADNIKNILKEYGYFTEYTPKNKDVFMNALAKDKKAAKGGISLALTGSGMEGKIIKGVSPEELGTLFF